MLLADKFYHRFCLRFCVNSGTISRLDMSKMSTKENKVTTTLELNFWVFYSYRVFRPLIDVV